MTPPEGAEYTRADDDVSKPADPEQFRKMMSAFPSGVAIVTTLDPQGNPRGMTCTSMCSVSLTPPTLLVCLDSRSGTLRGVESSGFLAVNLLGSGGRGAAEIFACRGPDRFFKVPWKPTPVRGLPVLVEDAHATAECRLVQTVPAGDHAIVVGAVETVTRRMDEDPLLYGRRRYAAWPPVPDP